MTRQSIWVRLRQDDARHPPGMDKPDMTAWAFEKIGNVLSSLAALGDIAKDPETPAWYKRNLRRHLHRGFSDGLKLLFWIEDRPPHRTGRPSRAESPDLCRGARRPPAG